LYVFEKIDVWYVEWTEPNRRKFVYI
jgi:hypothetical protein